MSASRMWKIADEDFPAKGSARNKLEFAVKYAALAPMADECQPWDFRITDAQLELIAKDTPELEAIDPDGRESIIGCGAALLHIELALKHFGCLGRIALFPNLDEPALVARVHFGCCRERDAQEKLLFEAMGGSRANVLRLGETPVSVSMLTALSHAVAGERGWLDFVQSKMSRERVMEISLPGHQLSMNSDHTSPRPRNALAERQNARQPRRLFAFAGHDTDSRGMADEPVPQFSAPPAILAVVKSKTDDKHGWLAAGRTLARTVLQAQTLGVSWVLFNPMRRRGAREALRTGVGHKGFAQLILSCVSPRAEEIVWSAHAAASVTQREPAVITTASPGLPVPPRTTLPEPPWISAPIQ